MGMLDAVLSLVPGARVGFIGLFRDEETLEPVEYYIKLPGDIADRDVVLLDPMLATGNSTAAAVETVKRAGATSVRLIALIAAPEGIARVHREHPDVHIVVASVDRGLNEKATSWPRRRRRPALQDRSSSDRMFDELRATPGSLRAIIAFIVVPDSCGGRHAGAVDRPDARHQPPPDPRLAASRLLDTRARPRVPRPSGRPATSWARSVHPADDDFRGLAVREAHRAAGASTPHVRRGSTTSRSRSSTSGLQIGALDALHRAVMNMVNFLGG